MINKMRFKNYKLFKKIQTLEIKPITVLIGKNSSGKSAVLQLPLLIENSLSGKFQEPLSLVNKEIEIGGEFKDLVYGRQSLGKLQFILQDENEKLELSIGYDERNKQFTIFDWKLNDIELDDISNEKFNGFLSESIEIKTLSLNTDYISCYREGLQRHFDKKINYESVGSKGQNVYSILIEDAITTPKKLINKVSKFYKENFDGWGIKVNQDTAPSYKIELEKDNKLNINLKEVGLGMIHALPLVVRALLPTKTDTLIIIEEPELHLHPAAHGNLAELFVTSLEDKNKYYLIETHSQNFVLRLRRLVVEGKLNKEDVIIYYVDFDEKSSESTLIKINIDELGKPRNEKGDIYWPKNIFSESLDETTAIRTAQLNKQ